MPGDSTCVIRPSVLPVVLKSLPELRASTLFLLLEWILERSERPEPPRADDLLRSVFSLRRYSISFSMLNSSSSSISCGVNGIKSCVIELLSSLRLESGFEVVDESCHTGCCSIIFCTYYDFNCTFCTSIFLLNSLLYAYIS